MADYIPAQPWSANPKFWDTIELAGKQLPGLAAVECERGNKWDTKQAKGQHGAKREFNGADLAKVKIVLRFITASEHEAFVSDHLPGLEPTPGKKTPDVISVGHAVTAARSVPSVTLDKLDGPKIQSGFVHYHIEATEFREPEKKNATGTAKGLAPGKTCAQYLATYQKGQADLATAEREIALLGPQYNQAVASRQSQTVLGIAAPVSADETRLQSQLTTAQAQKNVAMGLIQGAAALMSSNNCPKPPSTTAAATGGGTWYSSELSSSKGTAAGGTVSP